MGILDSTDKFFREATGSGYDYATIDTSKDSTNTMGLLLLVEGYRDAAFVLLRELTQNHDRNWLKIDSLIYPALYVYRHYLEIVMKDTLRYHRLLRGDINVDQTGFEAGHSLFKLWKGLRRYLEIAYAHENDSIISYDTVEALLSEFDEKDKGSIAFRYPFKAEKDVAKAVKLSLADFSIDLANLENICLMLSQYFEGLNLHAVVLYENKQEAANNKRRKAASDV